MRKLFTIYVNDSPSIAVTDVIAETYKLELIGHLIGDRRNVARLLVDLMLDKQVVAINQGDGEKNYYIYGVEFGDHYSDNNTTVVTLHLEEASRVEVEIIVGDSAQYAGIVTAKIHNTLFFISLAALRDGNSIIGTVMQDGKRVAGVNRTSLEGKAIVEELEKFYGRKYS